MGTFVVVGGRDTTCVTATVTFVVDVGLWIEGGWLGGNVPSGA